MVDTARVRVSVAGGAVLARVVAVVVGFGFSAAVGALLFVEPLGFGYATLVLVAVTLLGTWGLLRTLRAWRDADSNGASGAGAARSAALARKGSVAASAGGVVLAGGLAVLFGVGQALPFGTPLAVLGAVLLIGVLVLGALVAPVLLLQQLWRRPSIRAWEALQLRTPESMTARAIRRGRTTAIVCWGGLLVAGVCACVVFAVQAVQRAA